MGYARLLCASPAPTRASSIFSAAYTGLTTGTPTSAAIVWCASRKPMLMHPSASVSAPSSPTARRPSSIMREMLRVGGFDGTGAVGHIHDVHLGARRGQALQDGAAPVDLPLPQLSAGQAARQDVKDLHGCTSGAKFVRQGPSSYG